MSLIKYLRFYLSTECWHVRIKKAIHWYLLTCIWNVNRSRSYLKIKLRLLLRVYFSLKIISFCKFKWYLCIFLFLHGQWVLLSNISNSTNCRFWSALSFSTPCILDKKLKCEKCFGSLKKLILVSSVTKVFCIWKYIYLANITEGFPLATDYCDDISWRIFLGPSVTDGVGLRVGRSSPLGPIFNARQRWYYYQSVLKIGYSLV